MIIGKIENGIVLDHIKAGHGMELYKILGLDKVNDCQVALIKNAESEKMGRKNKKYVKTLHQQAYETLKSMQAFGESKKEAMKNGTSSTKIFSFSTCNFALYSSHSSSPYLAKKTGLDQKYTVPVESPAIAVPNTHY